MLGGYMGGQGLAARVVKLVIVVIASHNDSGDGCLTSSCLGGGAGDSGEAGDSGDF